MTITLTFDNLGEATALERGTWDGSTRLGRDPSVTVALPRLLDELGRHGLRATFCVEAIGCELYPAAVREIVDRGHELAAHGWRHEAWSQLDPDHEAELLRRCRTTFAAQDLQVTGFRPPGGELAAGDPELLSEHGFTWCSPAADTTTASAPVPTLPLRSVPFTWDLVDAYLLMDSFAELRERRGDPRDPLDAPAAGARLRRRLLDDAERSTLVLHPFLMLDDAWWDQTRQLLATIGERVASGAMRCLTAGAAAAASNPHLDLPLVALGPAPDQARRVAVLVHGRDQDDAVMRDVADRLQLPDVAYVLPVAAERSWYPGRYFDPLATLQPHLDWALAAIDRAVTATAAEDERIVIAGFSQGACLVAEYVARAGRRRFAGAGVLTGSLLGTAQERTVAAVAPALPMVVTCSRQDEWIALADALDTARRFRDAGAQVAVAELDDRVHHVSDRAVAELRALLAA